MKRTLLLERDYLIFDPWDAMRTNAPEGAPQEKLITFRKNAATGITLQVYGTFGISDLTGKPVIEDMEILWGNSDITNEISDAWAQELTEAILEEL